MEWFRGRKRFRRGDRTDKMADGKYESKDKGI